MSSVVVNGKEYEVPESFTGRELGIIKRLSGVRAGEISEALKAGDAECIVALTIVAMRRSGEIVDENALLDMTFDDTSFVWKTDEDEADANPPAEGGEAADPPNLPSPPDESGTPPSSSPQA